MKIRLNEPYLKGNEVKYLSDVITSGWLARGPFTKKFEEAFCEKIAKVKYGVAVTSGTVAVHVALRGLNVHGDYANGKGERPRVALPAYTCMSVPAAVKHANCEPVFIDVEPETWGMDYEKFVQQAEKTHFGAVIIVHSYGHIAKDTEKIVAYCREHGIKVLEDASEAHGAELNGKVAGQFGDVAAFSCRSEKMIGVGEGGIVVSNDKEIIDRAYYWVNDARPSEKIRYYVTDIGWNFHMPNAIGAIGLAQVEQFDTIVQLKRQVGQWYKAHFKEFVEMGLLSPIRVLKGANPVYWLNVYVMSELITVGRDDLMALLEERGFETRPAFYPLQKLPPYVHSEATDCSITDLIYERGIAFPSNPFMTEDMVISLKAVLKDVCRIK